MKTSILIVAVVSMSLLALPAAAPAAPAVAAAVNAERARHGLAPYRTSPHLRRSSRRYARHLLRRELFRHPRRLWIAKRFSLRGEALALHRGRAHARRTVAAWLGSPPHRAVLLHPRMRFVGVAEARGPFQGRRVVIRVLHAAG